MAIARTTNSEDEGIIPYDHVFIDTDGGWAMSGTNQYHYTVRRTGIYVISQICASVSSDTTDVSLYKNDVEIIRQLFDGLLHNGGHDIMSTMAVTELNEGDLVSSRINYGYAFSDARYQTSLLGFLYAPVLGNPIAWFVFAGFGPISEELNPIPYPVVLTNVGLGWDATVNKFIAPAAGVYYMQLERVFRLFRRQHSQG